VLVKVLATSVRSAQLDYCQDRLVSAGVRECRTSSGL
jgi:hypothetical protein